MRFIKKQIVKENFEKIEEESTQSEVLTEAVRNDRTYKRNGIEIALNKVLNKDNSDEILEEISKIVYGDDPTVSEELYAEDVDNIIDIAVENFDLSEEQRDVVEEIIINDTYNPSQERADDYNDDIKTLEDLLDKESSHKLYSPIIIRKVSDLIDELKNMDYTGLEQ